MVFREIANVVSEVFEAVSVLVLAGGSLWSAGRYGARLLGGTSASEAYRRLRHDLGHCILLGLEVLVVADIIRTVAVEPSLGNVATLGLIVLVRTFLSFSLEIEIEGVLPWRRGVSQREPAQERSN